VIHDSPTFCRLVVIDRHDGVLVDLAVDSPPHLPPTMTLLGPTLAPLDLAGRKLLALFGRAEARDFAGICPRRALRRTRTLSKREPRILDSTSRSWPR
jgi:hypothetical protein